MPRQPVEQLVFRNQRVEVGAFRCPADHPDFGRAGNPIANHHVFVFPRTGVFIRHEGARPFLAERNVVTLYNPGQRFERFRLGVWGDACDWFAVDTEDALEAVRAFDPAVEERRERCFRFSHAPSDARTYLAQRELFEALRRSEGDALAVEELVLWLLGRVVASAYRAFSQGRWPDPDSANGAGHDGVRRARALLAARFREEVSLGELAGATGLSRFRLCRLFRAATGTTLHAYREQLRLRAALEALASPSVDLTGLALELGYSSHSHFTSRFRRAFGTTPSRARGRLARRLRSYLPGSSAVGP